MPKESNNGSTFSFMLEKIKSLEKGLSFAN